jgi:hypothetical protein
MSGLAVQLRTVRVNGCLREIYAFGSEMYAAAMQDDEGFIWQKDIRPGIEYKYIRQQ